ncbi:MAG: hypothetical protein U9R00_02680 [Patescibacteria group bacterium]|nr:hypothetical protein [Patescibacteria group bacterium]
MKFNFENKNTEKKVEDEISKMLEVINSSEKEPEMVKNITKGGCEIIYKETREEGLNQVTKFDMSYFDSKDKRKETSMNIYHLDGGEIKVEIFDDLDGKIILDNPDAVNKILEEIHNQGC